MSPEDPGLIAPSSPPALSPSNPTPSSVTPTPSKAKVTAVAESSAATETSTLDLPAKQGNSGHHHNKGLSKSTAQVLIALGIIGNYLENRLLNFVLTIHKED
jgi:hypothetical protein